MVVAKRCFRSYNLVSTVIPALAHAAWKALVILFTGFPRYSTIKPDWDNFSISSNFCLNPDEIGMILNILI